MADAMKCLVLTCPNYNDQGKFMQNLICMPCYEALRGKPSVASVARILETMAVSIGGKHDH